MSPSKLVPFTDDLTDGQESRYSPSVRPEVITTDDAFESLQDLWSSVLQRSGSDNVFLTHEWLWTWWRHFHHNRQLRIILLWEGTELIGIAPLAMVGRKLEFLGEPVSDYHDLILVRRRRECVEALLDGVRDWGHRISYAELRLIPETSPNVMVLREMSHSQFWIVETPMQILEQVAPCVTVDGSWESYLAGRSASLRADVRQQRRRLSQLGPVRCIEHTTPEAVRVFLRHLEAFACDRFSHGGFYQDPRLLLFLEEVSTAASAKGWLEALSLVVDETVIAVHLGFAYDGAFSCYQHAMNAHFHSYSPGKLLLKTVIERAVERGIRRVDLGRGTETYKRQWATEAHPLYRFEIVPKRLRAGTSFVWRRVEHLAHSLRHSRW